VIGKLDKHFTALRDGGHIKFFSIATLRQLVRVSRISPLTKSMALRRARFPSESFEGLKQV